MVLAEDDDVARPAVINQGAEQEPRPHAGVATGLLLAFAIGLALACASSAPVRDEVPRPAPRVAPAARQHASPTAAYVVQPGETLADIARCSGMPLDQLARDNGITNPNRIWAGETLRLPAYHRCDHAVASAGTALAGARALLAKARTRLDAADFEGALAQAEACNAKLTPHEKDAKANALRAQCHVVAGTAATGLDRRDRAVEEFRRALAFDPKLELSSDEASPRVRELLAAARSTPAH